MYCMGVEPLVSGSSKRPRCRLCPRLGLCSLQTRVTNHSDQFTLPVQFLQPCIEFAIPLCELVHFGLQFANRHSCDKSHLRLGVTILPCASCLRDSSQEIAALANNIPFGDRIRNRVLTIERGLRFGAAALLLSITICPISGAVIRMLPVQPERSLVSRNSASKASLPVRPERRIIRG
jgi:hypothetical protein